MTKATTKNHFFVKPVKHSSFNVTSKMALCFSWDNKIQELIDNRTVNSIRLKELAF